MKILGVDVGGTFTDLVIVSENGELKTFKSSTTPDDPSDGIMNTLALAIKSFNIPLNIQNKGRLIQSYKSKLDRIVGL